MTEAEQVVYDYKQDILKRAPEIFELMAKARASPTEDPKTGKPWRGLEVIKQEYSFLQNYMLFDNNKNPDPFHQLQSTVVELKEENQELRQDFDDLENEISVIQGNYVEQLWADHTDQQIASLEMKIKKLKGK